MKTPKRKTVATAVLLVVAAGLAADDGLLLRKNLSRTPDYETEFAGINMAKFYVPAQKSDGALLTDIVYKDYLGAELFRRTKAKPLIVNYTDGHVVGVDEVPGFIGHGQRDAWAAVSLDDGASWMRTNLSRSGTKEITITTEGQPFSYYGCPAPCDYIPRRSYPLFLAREVLCLLRAEVRSARQVARTTSQRSTRRPAINEP